MVVAHPDDETIWGGQHLLDKKGAYTVICITNGDNLTRNKEFKDVVKKSGNTPVIYSFPDKENGKRSTWKENKKRIKSVIRQWVKKKNWSVIVTHNPEGEYGHQHHMMTSKMVTAEIQNKKLENKFYYFGKYTKKRNMTLSQLSVKCSQEKQKLIQTYDSQSKVMDHLEHMFGYEKWVAYKDWRQI